MVVYGAVHGVVHYLINGPLSGSAWVSTPSRPYGPAVLLSAPCYARRDRVWASMTRKQRVVVYECWG
jgi:hypothetical protein